MKDRTIIICGFLILLLVSLGCNAFAGRRTTLPPPPNPTAAPELPTATGLPGLAPTVTLPGETLLEPVEGVVRILVDLNIRSGPGVRFDRVGFFSADERATVIGRDPASGWWRINCPPSVEDGECWVSGGSQFTLLESSQ